MSAKRNSMFSGHSQTTATTRCNSTSVGVSSIRQKRHGLMAKSQHPRSSYQDLSAEVSSAMTGPGITVWCFENHRLERVNSICHGFFHQGNCYLTLRVEDDSTKCLHCWYGSTSLKSDRAALWACADDVDKVMMGGALMSCEYEGHETALFLRHFPCGIVICEGKTKQQLGKVTKYQKRLFIVKGRNYPVATCNECSLSAISAETCLILDGYPRTYVMVGEEVDYVSSVKAINLAKKIRTWQRHGKGHIVVIDKDERHMNETFMGKLTSSNEPIKTERREHNSQIELITHHESALYRVSGDRVMYDMSLAAKRPFQQKYLTTTDCFLLDFGPSLPLYTWVGIKADNDILYNAMNRAQIFKQYSEYPYTQPICRITEGEEPVSFKALFSNWRDKTAKERKLVRSYSAANIGRVLFSRSDKRTVAKLAELWSDDHFLNGEGMTEIWHVKGSVLVAVVEEYCGIFNNSDCYIILHSEQNVSLHTRNIYYWLGSKSTEDDKMNAQRLATNMDEVLNHETVVIQVLDGKEPKHFLTVLKGSIVVHDADLQQAKSTQENEETVKRDNRIMKNDSSICMYCIQEFTTDRMRVTQVLPCSSLLNSSAAFVILVKESAALWFGKHAKAHEREYAKNIMQFFSPRRAFDYEIFTEGKETANFWSLLHYDGPYLKDFAQLCLERRLPQLILCKKVQRQWTFCDTLDFSQEDLCENDIFLLDTHDQIYLWCGNEVADRGSDLYSSILQAYFQQNSSGRQMDNIQIWFINQEHEPSTFTKYFRAWDDHGYGGSVAYAVARKCVRQENAIIDPDCQMVDFSHVLATKVSYKQLIKEKNLPEAIDLQHKEHHLSDRDFTRILHITRAEFYRMPWWKQLQILKSAHLMTSEYRNSIILPICISVFDNHEE